MWIRIGGTRNRGLAIYIHTGHGGWLHGFSARDLLVDELADAFVLDAWFGCTRTSTNTMVETRWWVLHRAITRSCSPAWPPTPPFDTPALPLVPAPVPAPPAKCLLRRIHAVMSKRYSTYLRDVSRMQMSHQGISIGLRIPPVIFENISEMSSILSPLGRWWMDVQVDVGGGNRVLRVTSMNSHGPRHPGYWYLPRNCFSAAIPPMKRMHSLLTYSPLDSFG